MSSENPQIMYDVTALSCAPHGLLNNLSVQLKTALFTYMYVCMYIELGNFQTA